ncbi:MAG: type II toxin-antitoxin system HicB family antitoxin [Clostridiales Family XIII bacterium]|jgi:predicted RNase H-like HicB family nuclease|nr:type II toxin-antitoxin system HicB family antitoxin [Clostridiales Family XIII bacterium]
MLTKIYPAVFHEEDGGYWVEFPDVSGCYTDGDNLEKAMLMAQEALGTHLSALIEGGYDVPSPSLLDEIKSDTGFVNYVCTDVSNYFGQDKSVKKTLTIPKWLNDLAVKANINFSGALQDALKMHLHL